LQTDEIRFMMMVVLFLENYKIGTNNGIIYYLSNNGIYLMRRIYC